jgi:cyclophilin family peptidyl-prolyl cis-trans isomerase
LTPSNSDRVRLETSKGTIVIELDRAKAPVTVENFLQYVTDGFYDGKDNLGPTVFHRVIPGFMIQGGGLTVQMKQKPNRDEIPIESNNGLKNNRGTVAMARTNDPDSATSQFFINVVNNDFLNYKGKQNPGYAVFGKVVEGLDVVDAIVGVKTGTTGPYENVPVEPIAITAAEVLPT